MRLEAPPTRGGILREALGMGVVALAVSLCLFGECQPLRNSRDLGSILGEAAVAVSDAGTQWMLFVCAGIHFLVFVVIRRRLAGGSGAGAGQSGGWRIEDRVSIARMGWSLAAQWLGEPALWLTGLMVLGALAYAFNYTQAVKSTQALTLLGAAVLGQGAGLWESRKQKAETGQVGQWLEC